MMAGDSGQKPYNPWECKHIRPNGQSLLFSVGCRSMSRKKWKFDDGPDTASIFSHFVLEGAPITLVTHDYDGWWQFHGDQASSIEDAEIRCLSCALELDDSLEELGDLPYGWAAERKSPKHKWRRYKNHPFPSFQEDGYYLEDAVWMAQFRDDLSPPTKRRRENRKVGDYVKLLFRFAKEDAKRKDGQVERMWVRITKVDDQNGYYTGKLDNDPQHRAAKCGDLLTFHPLHIADIYRARNR